jgi:hypothetical protein
MIFHDDATHVSHRRSFLTFAGRVISHARACSQLAGETHLPAGTVPGNNMTGVLRQICDIVLAYPGHLQLLYTLHSLRVCQSTCGRWKSPCRVSSTVYLTFLHMTFTLNGYLGM